MWDDLVAAGIPDLVRAVRPDIADSVRATLNFNLPGSVAQHYHTDGLYTKEFLICNIAVVDTDLRNGAIDVLPGTNREFWKFWRYATHRLWRKSTRVPLRQGDVVVRKSTQWHRGMPNHSDAPRPMMAITFGEMDDLDLDPFALNDGKPLFFANWYKTNRLGTAARADLRQGAADVLDVALRPLALRQQGLLLVLNRRRPRARSGALGAERQPLIWMLSQCQV